MRNRYITALLVVLTSTGVEAQTIQSALKLALSEVTIEDIVSSSGKQALTADILSVIQSLKTSETLKNGKQSFKKSSPILQNSPIDIFGSPLPAIDSDAVVNRLNPAFGDDIRIRAPAFLR